MITVNNQLKILNIGCGRKIMQGAVNLDILKLPGVDVVHNLEDTPWSMFNDNTFDKIYAHHVLEHVDNFISIIEEIHRVLRPGGLLIVTGPYYMHKDTFTDPTHKRGFTTKTMQYFEPDNVLGFYTHAKFKIDSVTLIYNNNSFFKFIPFKRILGYFLWNIIQAIEFRMIALK